MEIDKEKYKKAIQYIFENLKALEIELLAHRAVLVATAASLDVGTEMGTALEQARTSPAVKGAIDSKYDQLLADTLKRIDQAASDQELLEVLRSWKPEGKPS